MIIGVDIRPTQTTVALADANGKFMSQEVMGTPSDPQLALNRLIESIQRIKNGCHGKMIEGVGISLPGRFDHYGEPPGLRAQSEMAGFRHP